MEAVDNIPHVQTGEVKVADSGHLPHTVAEGDIDQTTEVHHRIPVAGHPADMIIGNKTSDLATQIRVLVRASSLRLM